MSTNGKPDNRDVAGRFKPGQSGNPGGRKKGLMSAVREEVSEAEMVAFAAGVLRDEGAKPAHRFDALYWLADRGYGKAPQLLEHTGEDGGPIETQVMTEHDIDSTARILRLLAGSGVVTAGAAPANGSETN